VHYPDCPRHGGGSVDSLLGPSVGLVSAKEASPVQLNYFSRRVDSPVFLPKGCCCLTDNLAEEEGCRRAQMRRDLSRTAQRELIQALSQQYRTATKTEKGQILDQFVKLTRCHRKYAVWLLAQRELPQDRILTPVRLEA